MMRDIAQEQGRQDLEWRGYFNAKGVSFASLPHNHLITKLQIHTLMYMHACVRT